MELPSIEVDDLEDLRQPSEPQEHQGEETSFVPSAFQNATEAEKTEAGLNEREHSMNWPPVDKERPANEFLAEGLMSRTFPTLFPYGLAEYNCPRSRKPTIGEFFKHLLYYRDGRFAQHPRFRYWAFNMEMRWRALQTGRIFVDKNAVTYEQLEAMSREERKAFSRKVIHFAKNLRGTQGYWNNEYRRLSAMVSQLGLPTLFVTHSSADLHWPELTRLFNLQEKSETSKDLNNNPLFASWFFNFKMENFIRFYYYDVLGAVDHFMRREFQHTGSLHVHGFVWLKNSPKIEDVIGDNQVRFCLYQKVCMYRPVADVGTTYFIYGFGSIDTAEASFKANRGNLIINKLKIKPR